MESLIQCRHCNGSIEAKDACCRYCGKGQGQSVPFRYTHGGIIVLTLLFGPLAIPFIWKSPKIGKRARTGYFLLNLLITLFMLNLIFSTYNSINRQVQDTMKIIKQTGIGIDSSR